MVFSFNSRATSAGSTSISLLNGSLQCRPLDIGDTSHNRFSRLNVASNVNFVIPSCAPEAVISHKDFLHCPREPGSLLEPDPIRYRETFLMPLFDHLR